MQRAQVNGEEGPGRAMQCPFDPEDSFLTLSSPTTIPPLLASLASLVRIACSVSSPSSRLSPLSNLSHSLPRPSTCCCWFIGSPLGRRLTGEQLLGLGRTSLVNNFS